MYGKVMIGEKEVELVANAATPYRYKAIFHEDFLKKIKGQEEADPNDFFAKLGYVMAMQAEKKDMSKLSMETFYKWLEEFEPSDVFNACDGIAEVYAGNTETSTDPK